jgi:hypothetical protein
VAPPDFALPAPPQAALRPAAVAAAAA